MATPSKKSWLALVVFLIAMSFLAQSSESRLLMFPLLSNTKGKKIDSELLLREVINNLPQNRNSYHQNRSMLEAKSLDRVSPAGPDPQHH